MTRHFYPFVLLFFTLLAPSSVFLAFPPACHAAEADKLWTTSVTIDESDQQEVDVASDGAGGAIILWEGQPEWQVRLS